MGTRGSDAGSVYVKNLPATLVPHVELKVTLGYEAAGATADGLCEGE